MRRLVWVLWDAAAATLARRFLGDGALPNLARLTASGAWAGARPSWPCSQTPPGMATLATGAPTHVHAIYGYREAARPRSRRTALETESGFDARRLRAEPIWTAAARAGKRCALAFAPLANPYEAYAPNGPWGPRDGGAIECLDGYGSVLAAQEVRRGADLHPCPAPPPVNGAAFVETRGWRLDLPLAVLHGEERPRPAPEPASPSPPHGGAPSGIAIQIGIGRTSERFEHAWVNAGGASVAMPLGVPVPIHLSPTVGVVLILHDLAPDGRDLLLWRAGIWRLRSNVPGLAEEVARVAGPFLGAGGGHAWREGELGPTLRNGGTGEAERRFLASLAESSATFTRASRRLLREKADLTVLYEPCIDETAHLVQDLVEAALAGEGGVASRGLDLMREAYRLADAHLGAVLEASEGAIVAIGSDHGQQAVRRLFRPNRILAEAGLLAVDATGHIDLARTRVLYGPAGNGYLIVNSDDRPGGIVPRARADALVREAVQVLQRSGAITAALFPGEGGERGLVPGEDAGDAFVIAAPGVALATSPEGEVSEPASGGQHTHAVDAPELLALFAVGGPGVPHRGDLGVIDNRDVAPTLAALAGLPRPAHATGRALLERGD